MAKTRINIMLDNDVIEHFKNECNRLDIGYQTLINAFLRKAVGLLCGCGCHVVERTEARVQGTGDI